MRTNLLLLAGLGLAQAQDLKVSGNLLIGDPLPSDDKMQVAGKPAYYDQTPSAKPTMQPRWGGTKPEQPYGPLSATAPLYVGATTAEEAPYIITYDPKTKALTIMQRNGSNVAGGKVLVVCNPTSCTKEPK